MSPADVRVITELVRDDDGAVLWSDDTISVRSMTSDTLEEEIALKSDLQVPGTRVFGRVRLEPTAGLDYVLAGGFAWSEDTTTTMSKPTRWIRRTAPAPDATGLALSLTPNPASGVVTIEVTTVEPATVRVTIVDALGRRVLRLPTVDSISGAGSGLDVELSGLAAGVYVVRAESELGSATRTLVVAR